MNSYVLAFCVIVSMLTGILFGLAPALQASRPDLTDALKDAAKGSSGPASTRFRGVLVMAQVALCVILLVSAGLTIRSFVALRNVDLGFRPERVLTVDLRFQSKRYDTLEQRNQFAAELLERVRRLPGVEAATIGNGGLPFGGAPSDWSIPGQAGTDLPRIAIQLVSAEYLTTLGIPLRRGRMFGAEEIAAGDAVAVINETAAKLWSPGRDPIGSQVQLDLLGQPGGSQLRKPDALSPVVTVVGILGDTRNDGLRNEPNAVALLPYTLIAPPGRTLAIRTRADARGLAAAIRSEVRAMDPQQPFGELTPMERAVADQSAQPRFIMALFTLFAGFGLALATAGIYSLLSYFVSRSQREIGVRMALGAARHDVRNLILGTGGRLAAGGMIVGVLASLAVSRLLTSQLELFRVSSFDPISFGLVLTVLCAVILSACLLPARRAAHTNPMQALRQE